MVEDGILKHRDSSCMSEFARQTSVWIAFAAVVIVILLYVARNRQPPS